MTSEEPKVSPTGQYEMKEVCAIFGVCRQTIKRWVHAGKMKECTRRINNRHFYLGSEITRVWKSKY